MYFVLSLIIIVVFVPLGDSPASEFYEPTFRNTLFHLPAYTAYGDGTWRSKTSEHKIRMERIDLRNVGV